MAAELVLIGLMDLPDALPPHFSSAYTPIAAAGTPFTRPHFIHTPFTRPPTLHTHALYTPSYTLYTHPLHTLTLYTRPLHALTLYTHPPTLPPTLHTHTLYTPPYTFSLGFFRTFLRTFFKSSKSLLAHCNATLVEFKSYLAQVLKFV